MRAALALAVVSLACRSGTTGRPLDLPLCPGSAVVPPEARAPTLPLDPIRTEVDAPEWCRSDGWCWWNFPRGASVTAMWGSGASDVWATTDAGAMLHFDGARWSATALGRWLLSVWGVDGREAYALGGDGKTLRWDGTSWSELRGGDTPWAGAPAFPAGNVSASGRIAFMPYRGGLARFDGARWSELPGPAEPALWMGRAWAAGPDEAFAVGFQSQPTASQAFVLRFRDGRWDAHASEIGAATVNGSSSRDVWASSTERVVGELPYAQSTVERFDGFTWRAGPATALGPHGGPFFPAPGDRWLGDFHLEGGCWKQHAGPVKRLHWASAANDIWGTSDVGVPGTRDGELARWDGTRWSTRVRLHGGIRLLGEAGPGEAWALALVDEGWVLAAWNGATWAAVPGSLVARNRGEVRGRGFGTSARDVWLTTYDRAFLHWDGAAWTRYVVGDRKIFGWDPPLAGSGPRDVWAWNAGTFHWDGERWTELPSPGDVVALWVPAPGTVFALGVRTLPGNEVQDVIWRWIGDGWREELVGATRALGRAAFLGHAAIFGAAPDDGWAASNALYRWDGTSWTRFEGAPISVPACMWGTATDDVWAISTGMGGEGTWRWDGKAWTRAPEAPGCGTGRWNAADLGALWRRAGRASSGATGP